MAPKPKPIEERFWKLADRRDPAECWPWMGARMKNGYGRFGIGGGIIRFAHRVSYELAHGWGAIPEGMKILHSCPGGDNPWCVNPAHLRVGTSADNTRDAMERGFKPVIPELARINAHLALTGKSQNAGETNGMSKLNDWKVCGIMARYLQGVPQNQIAQEFSITPASVSRIIAGKTWRHLFAPEEGGCI